jgi:hypothetical protein
LNGIKAVPILRASEHGIEKQTEYNPESKTYTARCGVCGRPETRKKTFFRSLSAVFDKLRLQFNFCDTCGKWVCEDCYCVDDGNGNCIGICTACAKEQGITGYTIPQFEEAWPEIHRRIRVRNEAVGRAVEKEQREKNKVKNE